MLCGRADAAPTTSSPAAEPTTATQPARTHPFSKKGPAGDRARCQVMLEMNRRFLVEKSARQLTRVLIGQDQDVEPLLHSMRNIHRMMGLAGGLIRRLPADDDETLKLKRISDLIAAFSESFTALAMDDDGSETKQALLDSAVGLALYLDDENRAVVESAKLWQGVAYRRAGKPERALQVLHPVLTTPEARHIGLYARLERCRALADRGDYAAALAVAQRVAARVDPWFEEMDAETRRQAADSVRWTRIELLGRWGDELRRLGQEELAAETEGEANRLIGSDVYPPPMERWLALTETVSGIPQIPLPKAHDDAADETSPASEP
jgi:hypothetical protein